MRYTVNISVKLTAFDEYGDTMFNRAREGYSESLAANVTGTLPEVIARAKALVDLLGAAK